MNIVAADVGGTKSWFVVADTEKPDEVLFEAKYNSRDYHAFEPLLRTFLKESGHEIRKDPVAMATKGDRSHHAANARVLGWKSICSRKW